MEHRNPPAHNLFAADLDGTMIPVGDDPTHATAARELGRRLASREGLHTAFVTGRSFTEALAAVEEHGLPLPDALCCDVGTRIMWRRGEGWEQDEDYHTAGLAALGSASADRILETVVAASAFRPQADEHQTPVKVSFHLAAGVEPLAELERVRRALSDRRWTLSLVSSRCVYHECVLLDVLPGGVDKATAVHHVRKSLGIGVQDVVYSGDSGNDLAPLTAGFRAIIVANAEPDLARRIIEFATSEGRCERVYRARQPYLRGVLEGANHFGIF